MFFKFNQKKKYLSLLALLFCLFQAAYSQSRYVDGYIIKNDNDTVSGWIDAGNNLKNALNCSFKLSQNEPPSDYSPADIKAYRLNNSKFYVSKSVMVDGKKQLVFLECLVKGLVDLYFYENVGGLHYFVDKGEMIELINTHYSTEEDDEYFTHARKVYAHEKKEYVGVLLNLLQDSPKTCAQLPGKELDYNALIGVIVDYHKDVCSEDKCVVYAKRSDPVRLKFGVTAGCSYLNTTKGLSDGSNAIFRNLVFNKAYSPVFGWYLELKVPFINNDRLFVRYDMAFNKEALAGCTLQDKGYTYVRYDIHDEKVNMYNSLRLKFDFNKSKVRFYTHAGLVYKNTLHSKYDYTKTMGMMNSTNVNVSTYSGKTEFLKLEVGPALGLGLKTAVFKNKDLFLECNYMYGRGVTFEKQFKSNRFTVNMGIQIL